MRPRKRGGCTGVGATVGDRTQRVAIKAEGAMGRQRKGWVFCENQ